jgi:hypothetical protein
MTFRIEMALPCPHLVGLYPIQYPIGGDLIRMRTEVFDLIQSSQLCIVISLGIRINRSLPGIDKVSS